MKKGDIVIVEWEKCNRGNWPIDIVEELFKECDGTVCTREVAEKKQWFQRLSVMNLSLLLGHTQILLEPSLLKGHIHCTQVYKGSVLGTGRVN